MKKLCKKNNTKKLSKSLISKILSYCDINVIKKFHQLSIQLKYYNNITVANVFNQVILQLNYYYKYYKYYNYKFVLHKANSKLKLNSNIYKNKFYLDKL